MDVQRERLNATQVQLPYYSSKAAAAAKYCAMQIIEVTSMILDQQRGWV